ncbi:hypothetical protein ACN28S_64775 [Cystobacter fuscus]
MADPANSAACRLVSPSRYGEGPVGSVAANTPSPWTVWPLPST